MPWIKSPPPPSLALQEKQKEGRKGSYMLYGFGKVHSAPHHQDVTDYQVNFIANQKRNSLIVISMVADDLEAITNKLSCLLHAELVVMTTKYS